MSHLGVHFCTFWDVRIVSSFWVVKEGVDQNMKGQRMIRSLVKHGVVQMEVPQA